MDSDDYIETSMYERMLREAAANNAEIVVCGHHSIDSEGNRKAFAQLPERRVLDGLEATKEVLRDERIFSFSWDKIFLAELWRGIEYPEGMVFEDTATIFKVFERAAKVVKMPEPLYNYRQHGQSTLNDTADDKVLRRAYDNFTAFSIRYNHIKDDGRYDDVRTVCADKAFLFGTDAMFYDIRLNAAREYYRLCKRIVKDVRVGDISPYLKKSYYCIKYFPLLYKKRLQMRFGTQPL